jgi:hypothetical protein
MALARYLREKALLVVRIKLVFISKTEFVAHCILEAVHLEAKLA